MGELQTAPFQFTFNGFLKVAFQGSRITSDAGLILVRELDERLGLAGGHRRAPARLSPRTARLGHLKAHSSPIVNRQARKAGLITGTANGPTL